MTRYPEDDPARPRAQGPDRGRLSLALVIALSVYLLMSASRAGAAFASLWFLAVLPAYLCALICYVGDPAGTRSSNFYLSVPPILVGLVIIGSAAFLGKASSAWSCCPRSG
jgi:hypothetical protein